MKRILFLLPFLLFLFNSNTTLAASHIWQPITSDKQISWSFDTQSIQYKYLPDSKTADTSTIIFYVKKLYSPEMKQQLIEYDKKNVHSAAASDAIRKMDHCIVKYEYNLTTNTFKIYEANYCDAANTSLAVKHYPQPETVKVAPKSKEEKIFDTISDYATAHSDELTARAMN